MSGMDAGPGTDLGGLGWFVGVWVVMMAEKPLPWKTLAMGGVIAVLLALAIAVAVSPESVPGLTLP